LVTVLLSGARPVSRCTIAAAASAAMPRHCPSRPYASRRWSFRRRPAWPPAGLPASCARLEAALSFSRVSAPMACAPRARGGELAFIGLQRGVGRVLQLLSLGQVAVDRVLPCIGTPPTRGSAMRETIRYSATKAIASDTSCEAKVSFWNGETNVRRPQRRLWRRGFGLAMTFSHMTSAMGFSVRPDPLTARTARAARSAARRCRALRSRRSRRSGCRTGPGRPTDCAPRRRGSCRR